MNTVYFGPVEIDDRRSSLRFRSLIFVPGQKVSFEASGEDSGGPFLVRGVAQPADGGVYVAPSVPVECTRGGRATIRFLDVRVLDESLLVRGEWVQDRYEGSPWRFEGELEPIEAD